MRIINKILYAGIVWLALLISCKPDDKADIGFFDEEVLSISTFLDANDSLYSNYRDLIQSLGLRSTLNAINSLGDGYTLFLPTNEAFDRYIAKNDNYATFDDLLKDAQFARTLALYHLVNSAFLTSEFSFGALPDSTATGDYLTIGIEITLNSTSYMINNAAPIIQKDIEVTNGIIHVINEVLEPITFSSYQWLLNHGGFTILTKAIELAGLADTMSVFIQSSSGKMSKNRYTVFAEHDSIFNRKGIYTVDDLIDRYHTPGYELDDPEGGLYQFAAYHILEGVYYLDKFEGSSNYNSYAYFPVNISAGRIIKINLGVDTLDLKIVGSDTTVINYIELFVDKSNVNTKTGPIHFVNHIMKLFNPSRTERVFQFLEDPLIFKFSANVGTYTILDPNLLEYISWEGTEKILYVNWNNNGVINDYIEIDGMFTISYRMPKLLPGRYTVVLAADAFGESNATIRTKFDGKKLGGNISLTSGGTASNHFTDKTLGVVDLTRYEEHVIEISSLIPGIFIWDYVKFKPE